MQVDPIKLTLKAPGMKLLKLKYDKPLSKFAFKFKLRRYTEMLRGASDYTAGPYHTMCFTFQLNITL